MWNQLAKYLILAIVKRSYFIIVFVLILIFGVGYFIVNREGSVAEKKPAPSSGNNQTSESVFDKKQYSIDDPASIWVVVNKTRPLQPATYAPADLVEISNSQQLRRSAAEAFTRMQIDAKAAGYIIEPLSGYRSYDTQVTVYNSEVNAYGKEKADTESARPGYSEHQTGLGIDIGGGGCGIDDCFGNTPEGKWVAANAYKYGFIQRYTPDKVHVTGYRHESWHYRYVGTDLASEMHAKNIETLEDFFGLPAAPNY